MVTAVAIVTKDPSGKDQRCIVGKLEADNGQLLMVITNDQGYDVFKEVPMPFDGLLKLAALDPAGVSYSYPVHIDGQNVTLRVGGAQDNPQDIPLPACVPFA